MSLALWFPHKTPSTHNPSGLIPGYNMSEVSESQDPFTLVSQRSLHWLGVRRESLTDSVETYPHLTMEVQLLTGRV
jgi:ribosome modulation factor